MKLRSGLLAATVLVAAPVAASAQAVSGLYIGAGLGANFMQEQDLSVSLPGLPNSVRRPSNLQFSAGFVGLASVGYGFGNGLRLEVEGSYRTNKLKGNDGYNAGGDEQKYAGMVNVLYDFDPRLFGFLSSVGVPAFTPYVGVGLGYAWAQERNVRLSGFFGGPGTGFPAGSRLLLRTNQGEGSFAYQAILGGAFAIRAVPGLSLTAEYRFLGLAEDRDVNYQLFAPGVATRAVVRHGDDYNHSVLLGVRYAFNTPRPAPAPAPVAAPAPAPARTYLVFFDWDRADLTDRARQIIAEAAQATTRVQVTRIEVAGHTDTSGSASYNQGLSVRRAQNVAAELVRLGVPRQAITVQGFGESRPLVPTGDGVREPQNRRVEIVLRS